tara:strand:- start:989 stop:1360 length:372 start_codon:yes stop_codon:yes gene_type:complete
MDKLDKMLELRERFMTALKEKNTSILPAWPVNVAQKESQQVLRETVLKGVEEMFEALGHLKNWKPHRETEVVDFDREEFLEEFVDGMNYFLSVLVLLGHDADDLFRVYQKKDKIIHDRIKKGY